MIQVKGKFMKKLTAIACLSTLLMSPLAVQAGWKGNWLLGVSAGYNWHDGDLDFTFVDNSTPALWAVPFENDFDTKNWSWGILGGYQAKCNQWLLGLEVNVDWENETNTNSFAFNVPPPSTLDISATGDYKRDATIGLTGRIGYEVVCWLMPYLRAGIETSRDRFTVNAEEVNGAVVALSDSERSWRFVGGIGAELPVPYLAGLTFRAEYNYHSRIRTLDDTQAWVSTTNLPVQNLFAQANTHNYTNSLKASFVYNFDI